VKQPADALVFDLYGTLVDPLSIWLELERVLPSTEAQGVSQVWRRMQIEYAFRVTIMKQYKDFEWITARSLDFALAAFGLTLDDNQRSGILGRYDALEPFDDVIPALKRLAGAGHQLAVLSNGSPRMVQSCLQNSGLSEHFSRWISVDEVRAFKPDAAVYHLAAERLACPIERMVLVSCNAFDIVGGKAAGTRTAWVNRLSVPFDTIGERPDITVTSLADLADELGS
jgi:2-haloacid dehalogenase